MARPGIHVQACVRAYEDFYRNTRRPVFVEEVVYMVWWVQPNGRLFSLGAFCTSEAAYRYLRNKRMLRRDLYYARLCLQAGEGGIRR